MLVDLPSDNGLVHLAHIARVVDLPAFVKEADLDQERSTGDLPCDSFADVAGRKLPVHTKSSACLSYAYFLQQADSLPAATRDRIDRAFQKAAAIWNIKGEMIVLKDSLTKKVVHEKTACALEVDGNSLFPIDTPKAVYNSAERMVENRIRFPFAMRKQAAESMVKAAHDFGIKLSAPIHRMAGYGVTTKVALQGEINRRQDFVRNNNVHSTLTDSLHKLASAATRLPEGVLRSDDTVKFAEAIDLFDRTSGLTARYGAGVPFPEDVLCGFTKHSADKISSAIVSFVTGNDYRIHDLEKASAAFKVLDKDTLSALTDIAGALDLHKVADIVPTLPRDDAEILEQALHVAGVNPVALDKVAMVTEVLGSVAYATATKAPVKQAAVEHPSYLKRSISVLQLLKKASEDSESQEERTPRGLVGRYMNKAPNRSETNILTK